MGMRTQTTFTSNNNPGPGSYELGNSRIPEKGTPAYSFGTKP